MESFELEELNTLRKIRKLKAKRSLVDFASYIKEDYSIQDFHRVIGEQIDRLSERKIKKLAIFVPPQMGKSELSSRMFPAYLLGKNPKEKIILLSYNKTKASEFVIDSKRIIESKRYNSLMPNSEVSGKDTDSYYEINKEGFVKGAGMDSGVTGTSASCIIIDDPFKGRNEANSKVMRDRVWGTYQDDIQTRKNNSTIELLLFTRWHEDDIAGRLLDPSNDYYDEEEAKEWTVLIFQALKEKDLPTINTVIYEDSRLIDESLWEERHNAKKYIKRRRINPTGFQSLDQQRPTAQEGNKIRKEWFEIRNENELPFDITTKTADFFIDGAFTDQTKNDETALLSCYYNKANRKLYIFNCSGIRKELYELLPYFKDYALANQYKPQSSVYIELKASGHPLKSMLSKVEYGGFNTRKIDNKIVSLGKFNRVESIEPFLASGKVVLVKGSWNNEFIEQCASFPNGIHDDMVDVLAYAVFKYFIKKSAGGVSYKN